MKNQPITRTTDFCIKVEKGQQITRTLKRKANHTTALTSSFNNTLQFVLELRIFHSGSQYRAHLRIFRVIYFAFHSF